MIENQKGKKHSVSRKKQIPSVLSKKSTRNSRSKLRSNDFKSRFLLNLLTKKQELENTIRYVVSSKKDSSYKYYADHIIDELDRTDREIAEQAHYKFIDRKKNELKKVNILIDRINNDQHYGICEECGRRIPEARLLVIPEAVLCVPCQEDLENYESRTSYAGLSNSHSRYKNSSEQDDDFYNIDDAGVVVKLGSEPVSLMDMEDIDLEILPDDDSEEDNDQD